MGNDRDRVFVYQDMIKRIWSKFFSFSTTTVLEHTTYYNMLFFILKNESKTEKLFEKLVPAPDSAACRTSFGSKNSW